MLIMIIYLENFEIVIEGMSYNDSIGAYELSHLPDGLIKAPHRQFPLNKRFSIHAAPFGVVIDDGRTARQNKNIQQRRFTEKIDHC